MDGGTSIHGSAEMSRARFGVRTWKAVNQRAVGSLLLLCVLLLVIIWVSVVIDLRAEREEAVAAAMRETANRAQIFEDMVVRTLQRADATAEYLGAQYLVRGRSFDLAGFMRTRLAHLEPWRSVTVTDDKGEVVLSSVRLTQRISLRERDTFRVHLAPDVEQPVIGRPHVGVVNKQWTVPLSRRIRTADGEFAGVVIIGLDPAYFSAFQDKLALGEDSTATLIGRDGIVRARKSKETVTVGQDLSSFNIFRYVQQTDHGSYVTGMTLDNVPRIFSYRVLRDYPLIVNVGMSEAEALAGYRRVAIQTLVWACFISVLMLAFIAVALAQARRQTAISLALRTGEARYRSFVSATSRIVWTTDASGRVVDDAPSWRAYTGQSFDEFKGDGWMDAVSPEDRSRVSSVWAAAVATRALYQVEYRVRGMDGVYRPFVCRAVPVMDDDGAVREWIGVMEDVTAKKQDERERELLAMIVENANDAIFSRDLNGMIVTWNRAAEQMFGYTEAEVLGRHVSLLRAGDSLDYEQRNERIGRGESLPVAEGLRRTKDGRILNATFTVFPVKNGAGDAVGAAAIIRDVTAQHRAAETQALLAAIVENANDAIISRTPDGIVTSWNAAAEKLFGYTAAEAVGRHIAFIIPEDGKDDVRENSERLRRGETIPPFEALRRIKDGRLVFVVTSLSRVDGGSGEMVGVAVMIRDVSAQKKAEEGLRLAAVAYESAAEGIIITDANNNVVSVNRAYTDMTGYSAEEAMGRNPRILAAGQHVPGFYDELWSSVRRNGRWQGEVWDRRKNGERYCVLLSVTVVRDESERITQHCWILMDITARKLYEQQLITLNAELEDRVAERTRKLEHANQELSAFSYSVSHDLRAPIRAIQGYSTLLIANDTANMNAAAVARLQRIQDNAEHMGQLIDDLLRLSRVSQRQLERAEFDLTAVAEDVVHRLRRAEPQREVDIIVQEGMTVDGDASLVRHVMENLIGNAWKFTSRTARARIEVGADGSGERAVYYVKDNGAGFDMQYAHKLFSAFQRLHHREEFDGTGIGLSIVHRVVVKHGGTVWAQAEPGRGATFYFTLG